MAEAPRAPVRPRPGPAPAMAPMLQPLIPAAPARRRGGFALTPLADIMFQLLIFFMLSTSLAPYALLPLAGPQPEPVQPESVQSEPAQPEASQPEATPPTAAPQVIWHLHAGQLREGARPIGLEALPERLAELQADGVGELVIFVTPAARAQDLASLLEALQADGPPRVQLIGR